MARNNNKDKAARTPSALVDIHAKQETVAKDEKEKTVKMRFRKDMFYNNPNVPYYSAGVVYDVPLRMVDRWLKRGGEIYGSESKLVGSKVEETMPDPAPGDDEASQAETETEDTSDLE